MAFPHKRFSKKSYLFAFLCLIAVSSSGCFGAGSGGGGGGGSSLGAVGSPVGPGGGANPTGGGGNPPGTGNGDDKSGTTLDLGPNFPTGIGGPGNDPVNCHVTMIVYDSVEECVLVDNNPLHNKVKMRFRGHVVDRTPPEKIVAKTANECTALIGNLITNLPPTSLNPSKPPCCQGQWVRFIDELHHVYSQNVIQPDGNFDVTLFTRKYTDISPILSPPGYVPDASILPNVTNFCGGFFPLCKPDEYMLLLPDFGSPNPFPDESNLPPCAIELDGFSSTTHAL